MTQARLANLTRSIVGGEAMLSQRLSGVRPILLDAGLAYANALRVSVADFSPRLAMQVRSVVEVAGGEQGLRRHLRASFLTSDGEGELEPPAVADGRLLAKLTNAERKRVVALLANWNVASAAGKRAIEAAAAAVAETSPKEDAHET